MSCICLFHRFLGIPDPLKMDEEISSVSKHQSRALHPIDNCGKKASLKNIVITSSAPLLTHPDSFFMLLQDASVQAGDIFSQVSQTHDVIM